MINSRFRNGIKDLEVMMQNLIVSAFETVTTVEQGVEVLDIFMHLSSREVRLSHLPLFLSVCLLTFSYCNFQLNFDKCRRICQGVFFCEFT